MTGEICPRSSAARQPDRVKLGLDSRKRTAPDIGDQSIKSRPQTRFLITPAIVPRAPLKPHMQNVIANEMRPFAIQQQSAIGGIRTDLPQICLVRHSGRNQGLCRRRTDIRNVGQIARHPSFQ